VTSKRKNEPFSNSLKPAAAASSALPAAPFSGSRARLFWAFLLLIPILFFLLLEGGLRLFHYGGEDSLVLLRNDYGERYYQINREVARRYFPGDEVNAPDARGEAFSLTKSSKTFRIFCLGGSTTAGWPYQHNAGFPSQLQARLSLLFPERDFEVINVGVSAINSYSVLDFTRELLHYQPDLFLIYMGHNEFYGALGVASTQGIGLNRSFIKAYMALERLKLVQLMRNAVSWIRHPARSSAQQHTLMENMVGDKMILLDSPKYRRACADFAANLDEILGMIKRAGIPVLVSTLVSNIADQAPFESAFTPGFNQQTQWRSLEQKGDQAFNRGDHGAALEGYGQAAALDSMPAALAFKIGKCRQALGDSARARHFLERARDLDALRFRASSEFNTIIREVSARHQTPVVETEAHFSSASPGGLIGHSLILEHLHPNAVGYLLMADAFCSAMAKDNLVAELGRWPWERDLPPEQLLEKACITPLEEEIAYQRIRALTSRYPFREPRLFTAVDEPDYQKVLQGAVQALFQRKLSWNEAHYRAAEWLAGRKRFAEAAQEYRAVIRVVPGNYYPYLFLANMLELQGKDAEAEGALLQAAGFSQNLPFAFAKLGVLYMSRNEGEKARPVLQRAIALAGNSPAFTQFDLSRVHYLLGVALAQSGEYASAQKEADIALRLTPGEARVEKLLAQLRSVQQ
jgi:tetratricopeptide (TPR) repeat protein